MREAFVFERSLISSKWCATRKELPVARTKEQIKAPNIARPPSPLSDKQPFPLEVPLPLKLLLDCDTEDDTDKRNTEEGNAKKTTTPAAKLCVLSKSISQTNQSIAVGSGDPSGEYLFEKGSDVKVSVISPVTTPSLEHSLKIKSENTSIGGIASTVMKATKTLCKQQRCNLQREEYSTIMPSTDGVDMDSLAWHEQAGSQDGFEITKKAGIEWPASGPEQCKPQFIEQCRAMTHEAWLSMNSSAENDQLVSQDSWEVTHKTGNEWPEGSPEQWKPQFIEQSRATTPEAWLTMNASAEHDQLVSQDSWEVTHNTGNEWLVSGKQQWQSQFLEQPRTVSTNAWLDMDSNAWQQQGAYRYSKESWPWLNKVALHAARQKKLKLLQKLNFSHDNRALRVCNIQGLGLDSPTFVRHHFEQYGVVEDVCVPLQKGPGARLRPARYALVLLSNAKVAADILNRGSKQVINDVIVTVQPYGDPGQAAVLHL